MFTPSRLSLARMRRRLTKKGFAELLGVTPHTVLRYESGEICPPDHVVVEMAKILEFPTAFFFDDDIGLPSEGAVSFRSLSSMSAKERDAALAAGALAFIFADWVEERYNLPAIDIVEIDWEAPEAAALSLRQKWGLGERPIKNMIHLLESKGARVFSLAENTKRVDAFSAWRDDIPYVFLNMQKTAERSRFDAAHELAHLVLHKHGGPRGREAENEADRFAAEFLMPSADVMARMPRVSTLNQIIEKKKRWGVSVQALNYQLHKLGATTDWQYRTFCIQLTQRGFRDAEPNGLLREQSRVWQAVLTDLWTDKITKSKIAEQIHLPDLELENLLSGVTNITTGEPPLTIGGRENLRLVVD